MGVGENRSAELGYSSVISEATFSREYASSWRQIAPMIDGFVRRLNRGDYDRDFKPMAAKVAPDRRAFVNEVAFEVFSRTVQSNDPKKDGERDTISDSARKINAENIGGRTGANYDHELTVDEQRDIAEQVNRLTQRISRAGRGKKIICNPGFKGCGIVDGCKGDVLVGDTLFEIKAGDRMFRSIDVRQIITYLSLNRSDRTYGIESCGIINPRVGISFQLEINELSLRVCGQAAEYLFDAVRYCISSGEISR